ncbi:hypothetical protein J7M00_06800 [bacterium]|nr:hypothetical protein [bacterium]
MSGGTTTLNIGGYGVGVIQQPPTLNIGGYGVGIIQGAQPSFSITSYTQSVSVAPGGQLSINVTVTNNGDANGAVDIKLKDPNGVEVDSKQVAVDPNQSSTVTLTGTAPTQEGTYIYTVEVYNMDTNQVDDSKTVTVNVQSQPQPQPSGGGSENNTIYIIVIIIVIILLLILISVSRRR